MNFDLLKKNVVVVPVVIAILSGTVASIRYVLNLTNTINDSKQEIIVLHERLDIANEAIKLANQNISNINGVIEMSKEIMTIMGEQVDDLSWQVRDLSR